MKKCVCCRSCNPLLCSYVKESLALREFEMLTREHGCQDFSPQHDPDVVRENKKKIKNLKSAAQHPYKIYIYRLQGWRIVKHPVDPEDKPLPVLVW